jgi:hypothetical protein
VKYAWALGAVIVASVIVEAVVHDASHSTAWWHDVPGFDALYGLAGCAVIVVVSKALGALWLQRRETYFDDDEERV